MKERPHLYELADITIDGEYYPYGIYYSFEGALEDATTLSRPEIEESIDYLLLEIRERPIGYTGICTFRKVATIEWFQKYDEENDDYYWLKPVVKILEGK